MPSTITYKRGQVVVVNVPFSDQSGVKLGLPWSSVLRTSTVLFQTSSSVPSAASPGITDVRAQVITLFKNGAVRDFATRALFGSVKYFRLTRRS